MTHKKSVVDHRRLHRHRLGRGQGADPARASMCSAACASRPTPSGWSPRSATASRRCCSTSPTRPPCAGGARQVEAALAGATLAGLVNNAGIAVAGPLLHLPIDEWRQQLEVNLTGVVIATQAFAPLVGAGGARPRGPGPDRQHRLGRRPQRQPVHGPLLHHQVRAGGPVGIPAPRAAAVRRRRDRGRPGAVATPIWDKADETDTAAYANTVYAPPWTGCAYMLSHRQVGPAARKDRRGGAHRPDRAKPKVRYTSRPQPCRC
jgi:NAD(P)-dependent dehydrogenase (short-subunit alcohol dehydrogenase family)